MTVGGDAIVEADDRPGRDFHFRRAWLRDRLKAASSMLRVMTVEDGSMMPTLNDRDVVLVDMHQRSPVPPGIFVLRAHERPAPRADHLRQPPVFAL